ncbi:hypothetical protein Hsar01_00505 [Haloferula sargassicola]|uniref:Helicase ATP-binding domain-containing protein n=2 Tax=Haloferula sargassicola TaxID=490096 RepID=A0ABP9UI22_9BACT
MRREVRLQRQATEEIWRTPLAERVAKGHALGPLRVVSVSGKRLILQPADDSAAMAECSLREGDFVCLSQDAPHAPTGHFIHGGEDHAGIHLHLWKGEVPSAGEGWVIDPDFYDLSPRFAEAIEALAMTADGRDRILPLLMGDTSGSIDPDVYEDAMDELESADSVAPKWHDSQEEAIACCVAALDAHLVQGPPGTGKTRVLVEVARRLIERGERVLVTGPTHRAIHHALEGIRRELPATVRVAKIGVAPFSPVTFECHEDYTESGLLESDAPHVVGATPHALWSRFAGLHEARFDSVLLDEASQLTPLLAAMAMMRGEHWLFFGDDCQLPPVVLGDDATPPRLRSVFGRLKGRGFDTLLEETWRLNEPLAEWPSATFYYGRLTCRHDRRLVFHTPPAHSLLAADPAACLAVLPGDGCATVRADEEAQLAVDLVREAVRCGLDPERIGVITPFRVQAARVRQLLGIDSLSGLRQRVAVDTVERYQGQERDLIIITTAAADPRFIRLRADFLFQGERWNVAMTRARLKTIVISSEGFVETAESLAEEPHAGASCFVSLIDHLRHHAC